MSTPIWVYCHLITLIPLDQMPKTTRGRLPGGEMGPIRMRVCRYLGLDPVRRE